MSLNTIVHKLLDFSNLTGDKLVEIYQKQKSLTIELNDRLSKLNKDELSYWNCFEYEQQEESKYSLDFALDNFDKLHFDPEIRTKSSELNKELSLFAIEQSMREDVYNVVPYYYLNQFTPLKI